MLKYRIYRGKLCGFVNGKPTRASLLHQWKIILVAPQVTSLATVADVLG